MIGFIAKKIRVAKKCKVCNKFPRWARGMCKYCDRKANPGKYKLNAKRKATGERELFIEIWNERPHFCEEESCGKWLGNEPRAWFFSHEKPKSTHPELRLEKSNVKLRCLECHTNHDQGTKRK